MPEQLLALARSVALEAADLIRELRRGRVEVAATKSSPIDIVTEADRASERLIYERLLAARPHDGFLGEEGGSAASTSGVTWVVDPIDGTVNYLYGLPRYSVSIAARVDERVVAGVVVDVPAGRCFTAVRGEGARRDGQVITVRGVVPMGERLIGTGFHYRAEVKAAQAPATARMLAEVRDIRRLGSAALDLASLASGELDGYVEEGLMPWDLAAGGLIAEEAGARVEVHPGAGGTELVVAAPADGFDAFLRVVERCGFVAARREQNA
ncbi:MAG: inositol monophosphatase family protein [Nocardioidaceae bacterium]